MKIIVGISNVKDKQLIEEYVKAGADEFFIGYVPPVWYEKYGWEVSCNRRQTPGAQYQNREDVKNVVEWIHEKGKKAFLTLNEHEYTAEQLNDVLKLLESIIDVPFDAYIVANLAVVQFLRKNGIDTTLNVSIGLGCNNFSAIEFIYDNFENIGRVVLPRKLRIEEIETIANQASKRNIPLEAFGISSPCTFNDDYCFTWHSGKTPNLCRSSYYSNKKFSPIVLNEKWKKELGSLTGNDIIMRQFKIEERNEKIRNQNIQLLEKRKEKEKDAARAYLLNKAMETCGMCAMTKFKEFGIDAVKIAFRGLGFSGLEMLQMVKKVIDNPKADVDFCKSLINSADFCNGRNCYYNFPYTE
ncbi:MAG: U32 family peptidase [Bacteroidales bacterium]|nr:U32 family peptidase [Bacteroidales bacterium]MBN2818317.1 U32 family peptidase [Bacteroidales bacterium]